MGNEDGGGRTKRFAAYLAEPSWRACSATCGNDQLLHGLVVAV
jgi:hypothetical protein